MLLQGKKSLMKKSSMSGRKLGWNILLDIRLSMRLNINIWEAFSHVTDTPPTLPPFCRMLSRLSRGPLALRHMQSSTETVKMTQATALTVSGSSEGQQRARGRAKNQEHPHCIVEMAIC